MKEEEKFTPAPKDAQITQMMWAAAKKDRGFVKRRNLLWRKKPVDAVELEKERTHKKAKIAICTGQICLRHFN